MHKEIADMWVAALRSDEYGQTYGYLREEYEPGQFAYCALGVLCDIHAKATGLPFDKEKGGLPTEVAVWAGLHWLDPDVVMPVGDNEEEHMSITSANDEYGFSFSQLAAAISTQWERL
jgi:hypothetical protein